MSSFERVEVIEPRFGSTQKILTRTQILGQGPSWEAGTGTIIGPGFVLTAAHVVYFEPDSRVVDQIYYGAADDAAGMVDAVIAGDLTLMPVDVELVSGGGVIVLSGYDELGNPVRDLALVHNQQAQASAVQTSIGVAWNGTLFDGQAVWSAGFPGAAEFDFGRYLYETTGTISVQDGIFLGLTAHTGQSGSGVWLNDPGTGAQVQIGLVTQGEETTYIARGISFTRSDYLAIASALEASGITADQIPVEYLYGSDNGTLLGGGEIESITGTYLREIIRGDSVTGLGAFAGNDSLTGGGGSDVLQGMSGDDILVGDGASVSGLQIGNDFLDGGQNSLTSGRDIVLAGVDHTLATTIEIGNALAHQDVFAAAGFPGVTLTGDVVTIVGTGGIDFVRNVETISLVKSGSDTTSDTLKLQAFDAAALGELETIDLAGGLDVIDLGNLASGMSVTLDSVARYTLTRMDGGDGELVVWNANSIIGTDHKDKLQGGHLPANEYIEVTSGVAVSGGPAVPGSFASVIDGGGGDDTIVGGRSRTLLIGGEGNDILASVGKLSRIEAGAGEDTIKRSAAGTAIYTGDGADSIYLAGDTGIMDASAEDKLFGADDFQLFGGYRWSDSESLWARGLGGFRYAKTLQGELAIEAPVDRDGDALAFIANYQDGLGGGERTANLIVFEILSDTFSIGEDAKAHGQIAKAAAVFYAIWKSMTGTEWKPGVDPLVLDLDGDGIELIEQTNASPSFDLDNDGFAELTGWVGPDDGLLVIDLDGNGQITTAAELFGGPGAQGFAALSALDANGDGRVSAADAAFGDLYVWRDRDGDAVTDSGELVSLAAAGIREISTGATPDGGMIANNALVSTGTFTRTDGSTGQVGSVVFTLDQSQTTYLGGTTPSAAALALPELRGYGDLPSLRIAMTEHASLLALAQTIVPTLVSHDLAALRTATTPLLGAWAAAYGHTADDVAMLVDMVDGKPVVRDYGFYSTDDGHWLLGSGRAIVDGAGNPIAEPTLANVLAQDPQGHQWRVLTGAERAYVEAQFAGEIPIGVAITSEGQTRSGLAGLLELAIERVDVAAVRLLVQGPLHDVFFPNLRYDAAADRFVATTDAQLAPTFEAILDSLPSSPAAALAGLAQWKDILFTLIGDFDRGAAHLQVTYDFLFANLVGGFEALGQTLPISLVDAAGALGLPAGSIVTDDGTGTLAGAIQGEIYYLDGGNDHATGGSGKDVYVVGRNFGSDVIDDHESPLNGSPDLVRFASLKSVSVSAVRVGTDLVLTDASTGDTLRIVKQFEGGDAAHQLAGFRPNHGVEEIGFADGVVWDRLDMARAASRPSPTNDTLSGSDGKDVLDGGLGNDILSGMDDADIYVFGRGYGQDTIDERRSDLTITGPDYVELTGGIGLDDVSFSRAEGSRDLTISIAGTTDTLTILDQFHGSYTVLLGVQHIDRIEVLAFADGIRLYASDIMDLLIAQATTRGNDRIFGFYRADDLDGGRGDDFLSGGDDGDIYHWGRGAGNDTIEDRLTDQNTESRRDTLELAGGVTAGDILFSRAGRSDDLVMRIAATGETLTIIDQFKTLHSGPFGQRWFDRIEDFVFADGTRLDWEDIIERVLAGARTGGDDTIYGFDHADVLDGGGGNDQLFGLAGNDIYVFGRGYGHDIVDEEVSEVLLGQFDIVRFNADTTVSDIRLVRGTDQADLDIVITGTTDILTIRDAFFNASSLAIDYVEELHFADGTVLTLDDIKTRLLASEKTSGNDLVRGFDDRADVLDGGAGNDRMEGYSGSDTYVFDRGYGHDVVLDKGTILGGGEDDAIAFGSGVAPSDLVLERQGDNLLVRLRNAPDTLLIENMFYQAFEWYRIERFTFADGTTWSFSEIQDRLLIGTPGDDHLDGFNRPDVLDGGAGTDLLEGRDGNDTYHFGIGYGHDTIHDRVYGAGAPNYDTIVFGAGIAPSSLVFSASGNDLTITLASGDTLTILQQLKSSLPFNRVEEFRFADGTVWNLAQILANGGNRTGTPGNDTIIGGNGSERLEGLQGNDRLEGGAGSDTYVYSPGDGHDTIYDNGTGTDRVLFEEGISPDDVIVLRIPTGTADQNDILLEINGAAAGSIYLDEQLAVSSGLYGVEIISFADGTTWSREELAARAIYRASEGDDDIRAGNDANVISGLGGNDTIQGNGGADTLSGDDGDDILRGNGEDDILYGGAGADRLEGGDNADRLYGGEGDDVLDGGAGVDQVYGEDGNDLFLNGTGADLFDGGAGSDTVDFSGTTAARTINLSTGATGEDTFVSIENIVTGAGADQLTGNAADNRLTSNGGADILRGEGGDDLLQGGGGIDQLFGGDGNDRLEGGDANDQLRGEAGDDWLRGDLGVDTFDGGTGIDTLDLSHNNDIRSFTINAGAGTTESGESFTGIENVVTGGGNDTIIGDAGANRIATGAGADTLEGRGGDDVLDGGEGTDAARFSGRFADYRITTRADGALTVQDLRAGGDGADTLIAIESLAFSDTTRSYADVVNRAPTAIALSGSSLAESAAGGSLVGLLSATDPNGAADIVGFSLVGGGDGPFEIIGSALRLKAGASLDFETASTYPIIVRVSDHSGATLDRPFVIAVTNVNEAPVTLSVGGGEIAETAAAGAVAATLSAVDPDAGDTHTYTLAAGYAGPFEIAGNEIRLRAGAVLDREIVAEHVVPVVVTDGGGLQLASAVTIRVIDANEAPDGLAVTGGTVAENLAGGSLVATLAGHDPDAGDMLSYSLVPGYAGPFEIAGNAIRLKSGAVLDFETAPLHTLDVVVTDAGGLSLTVPVLITLTNVNEAPAGLVVDGGSIAETAMSGSVAARLAGLDPDAGDTVTIALDPGYAGAFELVGDELRLKAGALLDHELAPTHDIPVVITDSAGLAISRIVTIAVTNVNEVPSRLDVIGGTVAEDLAAGSFVATLAGFDPDAGDALTYALPAGYAGPFEIVGSEIRLRSGESLDFEAAASHALAVTTRDAGGLSRTDTVTITVTNVNEAPTGLDVSGGTVAENLAAGSVVATLAGRDPDAGDVLTYALPSGYTGPFEIVGNEIRLRSVAVLDYETASSHLLDVRIADGGGLSTSTPVTIHVTDVAEGDVATPGPDTLYGDAAANIIDGLGGDDRIFGLDGSDQLTGSGGTDTIAGGAGDDIIFGNAQADTLSGDAGNDTISGGTGDDIIAGGAGADSIQGGLGNDLASGDAGDDVLQGGEGADDLRGGTGADEILGQTGSDILSGQDGADLIRGGDGSDRILGGEGADSLYGDADADTILGGIDADLILGGGGDDMLYGEAGADRLEGGAGADLLDGGGGNDRLIGGGGNDTITTGAGADTVVFSRNSGVELVTDFENDVDTLEIAGFESRSLSIMATADGATIVAGSNRIVLAGITVQELIDDIRFV